MLEKLFIDQSTKKITSSDYSPFETIQLLFEIFFNILNNKGDIQQNVLMSKIPER